MLRFQLDTTGNLLKDLIAFWPLDEPGGQRRDMLGYNPLTDNNTVASAKGIGGQGTSAKFTRANSEYLSVTDNPQVSLGDVSATLGAWVYLDSKPSGAGNHMGIIGKWTSSAGNREWTLYWDNETDRFTFIVRNTGDTANASVKADNLGAPTTGLWYFIVAWHDPDADQITIQVNNGTANTTSHTGGVRDGGHGLQIGRYGDSSVFWDGRIQYVGFWKRVLSQQERTDLYNFGRGNRLIVY